MRRVSITSSRPDVLAVRVGRDRSRVIGWSAVFAVALSVLFVIDRDSIVWLGAWFLNLALLPAIGVALSRFGRATERTLVRSGSKLMLDGEPIEMARVELRVTRMPVTSLPNGYALSLWVMTAVGPEDLPIGHSKTLLEASMLSGTVEDFVQRANAKQPRHV